MVTVKDSLDAILASSAPDQELAKAAYEALGPAQQADAKSKGYRYYQGKVRELLQKDDGLWIVHSDRLSAFDKHVGLVPYKGQILCQLSRYWLERAAAVMLTQLIDESHPRVLKVKYCEPVKAEIIMRGYLAGSMARAYAKGERDFCGNRLPEGLTEFGPLHEPILTPTTKGEKDEPTTADELIASGVVTKEEWATISKAAFELFKLGTEVYKEHGWILVDTKYEMGRDENGNIVLIDELHTPDSSRLWRATSYGELTGAGKPPEMFDKEVVRRYLIDQGFMGEAGKEAPKVPADRLVALSKTYLEVAEKLLGKPLEASGTDISHLW